MNFDDEEGGLKLFPQPCWGYIDLKLEKLGFPGGRYKELVIKQSKHQQNGEKM